MDAMPVMQPDASDEARRRDKLRSLLAGRVDEAPFDLEGAAIVPPRAVEDDADA